MTWFTLPLAFFLDLVFGDPQFRHHPIRFMGKAIEIFEPRFRRLSKSLPIGLTTAGGLFAVTLILMTWGTAEGVLNLTRRIHSGVGIGLEVLMIYFCISAKALESAAMEIHGILVEGDLKRAKEKLSLIVGRDVRNLSKEGVARAAVETVAENLVDGVIAPLFFAALGGGPLAMAYKMVNTLDSMVGYKNDLYREFGAAAARIDDAANFIPARLSVPVIALGAQILARKGRSAWTTARREGRRHTSPNAGFPEAAFAGTLRIRLGGPNIYHGKRVHKPYIGIRLGAVKISDVPKACDLMILASLLWVVLIWMISLFISLVFG
jgi:adenosylcobinamide-phosphate synthase